MKKSSKFTLATGLAVVVASVFKRTVDAAGSGNKFDAASPIITYDDVPLNKIGELETSIGFYQAIELADHSLLYSKQSRYQAIEVHQSKYFGKVLVLDGVIQLTERDADSYNEMMAHIPMFQHPNPKRVLIVGGGDGYVLKEVRTKGW
jgi:hypothetical protein